MSKILHVLQVKKIEDIIGDKKYRKSYQQNYIIKYIYAS